MLGNKHGGVGIDLSSVAAVLASVINGSKSDCFEILFMN